MSTESQRKAWATALCKDGQMRAITLYGGLKIQVHTDTLEAFAALSAVLAKHGYRADPKDPGGQLPEHNGRLETFPSLLRDRRGHQPKPQPIRQGTDYRHAAGDG